MVVKVKEKFEKTRHVKNNDKSKKNIFYKDKEMQDIIVEFYLIKRNLIISQRIGVQKMPMTSVASKN